MFPPLSPPSLVGWVTFSTLSFSGRAFFLIAFWGISKRLKRSNVQQQSPNVEDSSTVKFFFSCVLKWHTKQPGGEGIFHPKATTPTRLMMATVTRWRDTNSSVVTGLTKKITITIALAQMVVSVAQFYSWYINVRCWCLSLTVEMMIHFKFPSACPPT